MLTKRGPRLRELDAAILQDFGEWPANVWQGVYVCSSAKVEMDRITALGQTHARIKWISFEPWLSNPKQPFHESCPDLASLLRRSHIDWTVIGGESGPKKVARLMTLDDARYIASASREAGTKVHFKQLGTKLAQEMGVYSATLGEHASKGGRLDQIPEDLIIRSAAESMGRCRDSRSVSLQPSGSISVADDERISMSSLVTLPQPPLQTKSNASTPAEQLFYRQ